MPQTRIKLTAAERRQVQRFRSSGQHAAREVNRAHILAALDRGVSDAHISAVLGVSRMAIWRTRSAHQEKGLAHALHDLARSGAPAIYSDTDEAAIAALARDPAPAGRKRWTLELLTQAARAHNQKLRTVSPETVRRWLKKHGKGFGQLPCGDAK